MPLLGAQSAKAYPKVSRQFQLRSWHINFITAISTSLMAHQFHHGNFNFVHSNFNYIHGNFNFVHGNFNFTVGYYPDGNGPLESRRLFPVLRQVKKNCRNRIEIAVNEAEIAVNEVEIAVMKLKLSW